MLDNFLKPILAVLASVWRTFGSPRIVGDEKAAKALKTAWEGRGSNGEAGENLGTRTRNAVVASSGVLVAILVIWLLFAMVSSDDEESASSVGLATPTPFAGPLYMTEVRSLSLALTAARDNGLVSQDFEHVGRRIQFGEYAAAIGEADRAERGLLETPPETEVWAFAFAGDVQLELSNGEHVDYDNLTVVLDALTGQIYRVEAFFGDYKSEARAPEWLRPPTPTPAPAPTATRNAK
jgi:hypothetical protein